MTEKNDFGYRTDKGWRFNDLYTLRVVSHSPIDLAKVRDDYLGAFKPVEPNTTHTSGLGTVAAPVVGPNNVQTQTGLLVKIAATHAGLITRNNGFYMPDKMRSAATTWTEHYHKPIQVHHNDSPGDSHDPIGRVIAARYVDTSSATIDLFQNSVLRDDYNNQIGKADKKFWDAFISDKTSFIKKLGMIRQMDSVLNDTHYQGVGYIELTANITDKDAIQKVLDGRYFTGSVGAVSDKAVCSVCNTDWLESENCGHRPGRLYDAKKCVVVAGNLEYDEYSFVNVPADRHSGIIGLEIKNSVQDSAVGIIKYFPVFSDSEETVMRDNVQTDSTVAVPELTQENTTPADVAVVVPEVSIDDKLNLLMDKLFTDEGLTESELEELYELQLFDMDKEIISDAKLSTETRKKLASSVFCGPGRSFPVPDCAHATAAKRLVGRFKGDKSEILACVSRKSKAMGCNEANVKAQVQDSVVQDNLSLVPTEHDFSFTMKFIGEVTDQVKLDLSKTFLQQIIDKFGKDTLASAALQLGISTDQAEIKTLLAEITKYEESVGELRGQLASLRRELKAAYNDVTTVEDQLILARSSSRLAKTEKIKLLHTLEGSLSDAVKENLLTLTDEALDSAMNTMSTKVDILKIVDKLNSGLSRTPDEPVDIPAGLIEPSVETKPTNKPTFATQQMVDDVYRRTLFSQGFTAAQAFYTDAVKSGLASPKE